VVAGVSRERDALLITQMVWVVHLTARGQTRPFFRPGRLWRAWAACPRTGHHLAGSEGGFSPLSRPTLPPPKVRAADGRVDVQCSNRPDARVTMPTKSRGRPRVILASEPEGALGLISGRVPSRIRSRVGHFLRPVRCPGGPDQLRKE
jgi:hypothetical protein